MPRYRLIVETEEPLRRDELALLGLDVRHLSRLPERKRVPTGALMDWQHRNALTNAEVARAAGWFKASGSADGKRVRRALEKETVLYSTAVTLAHAMLADPVDFDF